MSICLPWLPLFVSLFNQTQQSHVSKETMLACSSRIVHHIIHIKSPDVDLVLSTPAVPVIPSFGVLVKVTVCVDPSSSNTVSRAETNGSTSHGTTDGEAAAEGLTTTQGKKRVEARPGSRQASAAGGIARKIEVG
jgi:hypothetical protein